MQNAVFRENYLEKENGKKVVIKPYQQMDVEMHDHTFFELAYITGGTAEHNLNGNTSIVCQGDYFIVDYGSVHSYQNCRNFTLINCLFLPELIDETLADCRMFEDLLKVCLIRYYKQYYGFSPVNRIFHDENGEILALIRKMQEEYENRDMGFLEILRGKLLEVLILTMRKITKEDSVTDKKTEGTESTESTVVTETIRYLKSHYKEHAVLHGFCEKHHYSIQYISRKFKQETGFTVLEYLQKIRIEKCCELLSRSDMPIQEIAHEIGYDDMKFFHKVFRRMLHMSPGEYRKMTKG